MAPPPSSPQPVAAQAAVLPMPAQIVHLPPQPPAPSRADSAAVGMLTALASVLAARLLLLLSVVFGFVLALYAMHEQSWASLAILGVYACLTVLPLVYLDLKTRVR